jgi:hypothetical protein
MKIKSLLFFTVIMLIVQSCNKKEENVLNALPEGSVNLSDLSTKHDYYLPFAIVNNNQNISSAILNNEPVTFSYGEFIEFRENGFFELIPKDNSSQAKAPVLFTTKTIERENSEWGIRAWVPVSYSKELLGSEEVEIFYPHRYAAGIKVPFIFYAKESGTVKTVYSQGKCISSGDNFNIKRGVGSVNIDLTSITDKAEFTVGGKQLSTPVVKIQEAPLILQGTISTATDIPANSYVKIPADLNIASTGSLTIHEGTLILIDEAVDVNVNGPVVFSGTAGNPVFVTCSNKDKFWGGFLTRVSTGTIEAKYTIFCQSGYHVSAAYKWGHSGRQALFYTENSTLKLDHCFMTDHIGQVFYPQKSVLTFNNILVQRVQTGGQINTSRLTLRNSVFTDFPEESDTFLDLDNDALYLSASDAVIDSTTFMFAKDDGLDSGNTEGGEIVVTNCRFEACFHEGAALSSGNGSFKNHTFSNCIFTNCGQGLELGFSSPNHTVLAENCQFLKNGVGIRYGDNYTWANVEGNMHIKNSVSLDNDKDVWNMVRMNWSPKLEKLSFENTQVSALCPQYPELKIRNN